MPVIKVEHPILEDCLAHLRDRRTDTSKFREYMRRAAVILTCHALRDFSLRKKRIETPIGRAWSRVMSGQHLIAVPVLRAGLGMLPGFLELVPGAVVGLIGLYRDEKTFAPHRYYLSLPGKLTGWTTVILDPMLATGGSMVEAIRILKERGAGDIRAITLVAAPEGVARVERSWPEERIYTASVDRRLNGKAYIVPGIGDAGDRLFGT